MKVKGLCLANTSFLRDYFDYHKVPVYLESTAKEIKENQVIINQKGKTVAVDCDNVIVSIGYKSNPLFEKQKNVYVVGDAYKVGNLRTVIWRAWDVAKKL